MLKLLILMAVLFFVLPAIFSRKPKTYQYPQIPEIPPMPDEYTEEANSDGVQQFSAYQTVSKPQQIKSSEPLPVVATGQSQPKITRDEVAQAVIWAEIIAPPLAKRPAHLHKLAIRSR